MEARFMSEYKWGKRGELKIDHADIFWTNFSGDEKINKNTGEVVNVEGTKNFNVYIYNEELALEMRADGWKIKELPPRSENESTLYFLPVELRWRDKVGEMLNEGLQPKVHMEGTNGEENLGEMGVGILDNSDIYDVGLTIRARRYKDRFTGADAIKAFLAEGWFVIEEDTRGDQYRIMKDNKTAGGQFRWCDIEDEVIDVIEDLEKQIDIYSYQGGRNDEIHELEELVACLASVYGLRKG